MALGVITGGSFLLIGVQMIYPVLLPELRATYGLDLATAGVLLTLLWVANAAGQIPGGMLADRIGEKQTLVTSVLLSASTLLLILLVNSVVVLFVATFLLGGGLALFGVARYTAMYDMFPNHLGTTIGIVQAGADAGQALLPLVATILAVTFVWQLGFGFTIPLFLLIAAGLWVFLPPGASTTNDPLSFIDVRNVVVEMQTRAVIFGTATLFVYAVIWVAFTSFYPTYLLEVKGLSPFLVALFFGMFFATGVVVKPLCGIGYDRIGIRVTLFAISVVSGIALVGLPLVENAGHIAVLTVLVGPILGTGTIAQSRLLVELSSDSRGTGLGVVRTGTFTVAAATPTVFGAVAGRGFFDEAFISLAAFSAAMALLALKFPPE